MPLRGGLALIVRNMEASRELPTATSYRHVPVKVLEENRRLLNHYLELKSGPKVSFTHMIAWAVLRALAKSPVLNDAFTMANGEPHRVRRAAVNLGMAVDMEKKDGSRTLLVPNLRNAGVLDFRGFVEAYTRLIEDVRAGRLGPEAFQGTTISITNPGTVGTESSVPRLMPGQGAIIAVGSIGYSAETRAMSPELLSRLGIGKSMTISCTYDHRIVQGAESGEFLGERRAPAARRRRLLRSDLPGDGGAVPAGALDRRRAARRRSGAAGSYEEILRQARVLQLINAYRVRGHLIAHLDPLGEKPAYHPELDPETYGLTLWDLDRTFITGASGDQVSAWEEPQAALRDILQALRSAYCGKVGVEYMNIQDPEQKRWIQERVEPESARAPLSPTLKKRALALLASAEAFEKFLHARFIGHKRFSLEGGETLIPVLDTLLEAAAREGVRDVVMGMAHRGRLNVLTQILKVEYANIFSEFQGNRDPHLTQGSGDVKYHLGATGVHVSAGGGRGPDRALAEPEPPGGGGPGGGGDRARQAGAIGSGRGTSARAAGAGARRRRLRRRRRGRGDAQPVAAEGLPHRRHRAHHRQQPDRLHHPGGVGALLGVLHRRGEDGPGADLPRERRRSGSRGAHRGDRLRVPAGVPQGRGGGHRLLPPARAQRGRRADLHAAALYARIRNHPSVVDALHREAPARGGGHRGRARHDRARAFTTAWISRSSARRRKPAP